MTIDDIKLLDSDTQNVEGSKIKQSRPAETLPPSYSLLANSKDTTADEVDTTVVFSSQKSQFADYTTWKGIETKTGIEPEDAVRFLVKELLDNALDYLESSQQQNNEQQPQIHVIVEKHKEKYIRITVRNSNYVYDIADNGKSKAAFSKQMLKNVFDLQIS